MIQIGYFTVYPITLKYEIDYYSRGLSVKDKKICTTKVWLVWFGITLDRVLASGVIL